MGFFLIPFVVLSIGTLWSIMSRGFVKTIFNLVIGVPSGTVLAGALGYLLVLVMAEYPPKNAGEYGIVLYFWWLVITTLGAITGFYVMVWRTGKTDTEPKKKRHENDFVKIDY